MACISLGDSRIFRICGLDNAKRIVDVKTENGQLLVMDGDFQQNFRHSIPERKNKLRNAEGHQPLERVSLTFRRHFEDNRKNKIESDSSSEISSSYGSSSDSSSSYTKSPREQVKKKSIKPKKSKKSISKQWEDSDSSSISISVSSISYQKHKKRQSSYSRRGRESESSSSLRSLY